MCCLLTKYINVQHSVAKWVFMKIKIDANGKLLEIKVSEESTASNLLIRAAKQAIIEEAPFAQFAQVLTQDTQWFDLNVNYKIARSN